ncbi:DUF4252 domain-containing protein [Pararhodonellum marinum]|uniref:DUF4252 domain-containing protein n=1 Tax=Pararhodonellum marinum TaxID=2755358 RepID=UPI0018905EE0|nr:DUF4252 domain-containing protein [Pararhodonellum marinum]
MKKIILFGLLMTIGIMAHAQSKSVAELYNKHKANENFFHLDLAGNFMNFAKGFDLKLDEANLDHLTSSVDKVRLFKLPYGGQAAKADFQALQKGLQKEKFDLMMEMTEKSNGIMLYSKGSSSISDLILLINGKEGDYMVVELTGKFDPQALEEAGNKVGY